MSKAEFKKRWRELDLEFFNNVASEIKKLVLTRFDKEQDVYGNKFEKLKPSTVRERGDSNPILKRTGFLRDSIQVTVKNQKLQIFSTIGYAEDLHQGRHSGKWGGIPINAEMKPRKFLAFPKEAKQIVKKFQKQLSIKKKRLAELSIRGK
jgi:phage gpG-like protein